MSLFLKISVFFIPALLLFFSGCMPAGGVLRVESIKVSTFETSYIPENMTDGDRETFFTFQGRGSFVTFELPSVSKLGGFRMLRADPDTLFFRFDLEGSIDGKSWTKVIENENAYNVSYEIERWTFEAVPVKYIKLTSHNWAASIREIEFYSRLGGLPPGAPEKPVVLSRKSHEVTLEWSPPASGAGESILKYHLFRGAKPGPPLNLKNLAGITTEPRFTDTALAADTTYYYKIIAFSREDLFSESSPQLKVTTLEDRDEVNARDSLFHLNFDHRQEGPYDPEEFTVDWNRPLEVSGLAGGRVSIVSDPENRENRYLRIYHPSDSFGGANTGARWRMVLPGDYFEELYFSYRFKVTFGLIFTISQNFPGLDGGRPVIPGDESLVTRWSLLPGWSRSRLFFTDFIKLPDQHISIHSDPWTSDGVKVWIEPGLWHLLEVRLKLNRPGKEDGLLQGWMNRHLLVSREGLIFRDSTLEGIDSFHFSTLFNSISSTTAPETEFYIYFDDFVISEKPITH